ncbi:xylulokinase [Frankineae bacterium MT45]|nr:xylulokinase [Frankineae bacterium MT45]
MELVAGVDSSTQSCKVVIRDAASGELLREGRAAHPDGTAIDPEHWWVALQMAITDAGGLQDVAAVSVGGQQHGMVCLDSSGEVIRDALLWNDTRSSGAALDLIGELGGARAWAEAVGSVPVASYTVTKLRWLQDHEPANAARTAAVCLPHDWLTWRLAGSPGLEALTTDRGDASGTGYWSPASGEYRHDIVDLALGHDVRLPRVLGPAESAGQLAPALSGAAPALLGPGSGDNAAAALGLGAVEGDVIISIGTSGVVCAVSSTPVADASGTVSGFASATGSFLPLIATLNAARVLDATAELLGVDHEELSRLALSAEPGAGGLTMIPYLEGERTPNRPDSTGALHGMRMANMTPANLARAAVEGLLCGLADGMDALVSQGVQIDRAILIGGGAKSEAVCRIAPSIFGRPVMVPAPGEYVADGAARQAAWVLNRSRDESAAPPSWVRAGSRTFEGEASKQVRDRYAEVRDLTANR